MAMPQNLRHWTAGVHHDGSDLYVSNLTPGLDETVTITLRVPVNAPIGAIYLRTAPDGENHLEPMHIVDHDARSAYWAASLHCTMPLNNYRFKIISEEGTYYLSQRGLGHSNGPDWDDFKIVVDYAAPLWVHDAVFYQIFPDRFYNSDPGRTMLPETSSQRANADALHRVQMREWGTPPLPWSQGGNLDYYGGDLPGIAQKLDYLEDLGINALYLNPIFESDSNHRYNIHDFYKVDAYLGGNEAFIELRRALDARRMSIVLDITPNHVGSLHPWFLEAQNDPNGQTADFFTFYERPNKYLSWLGVSSLPKLNYRSQRLREMMYEAPESVMRFWLADPYRIDGWRLDVQNMTARQGGTQLDHKVGRAMRRAIKRDNPQAYLFGEHFYDGTPYLQGNELDAIMNYQGFNIPMWRWLSGFESGWQVQTQEAMPISSEALEEQLRLYRVAIPWVVALQQFNQLCSHDTVRILTIVNGDKRLMKLGLAMTMAYPGVPCIYYGDEIGLEGENDPDNRRTMPWDETQWDMDLRRYYQRAIGLRRESPALKRGGYQQVYAQNGVFAFQRHCTEQRMIIIGYRGDTDLPSFDLPVWHTGLIDGMILIDRFNGGEYVVENGIITLHELTLGITLYLEVQ